MAEAAGLAVGVLGIAGLFTSCIQNFDIIVRAKDCSEEFELLCTILALQRLRLSIWGETLGLVPGLGDIRRPYNHSLDRPDIRPIIESSLLQLQNLLEKAAILDRRYRIQDETGDSTGESADSKAMTMFREPFEQFKSRLKKAQKQKSIWKVTRWSVHDFQRFESLVDRVKDLMDALESVTAALGLLATQHAMLVQEVESLSDTESLHRLQEACTVVSCSPALKAVSDTASQRLTTLTASSRSFYTAYTEQPAFSNQASVRSMTSMPVPMEAGGFSRIRDKPRGPAETVESDIPQNQRWMMELMERHSVPKQTFLGTPDDYAYGTELRHFKERDEVTNAVASGELIIQADQGLSLARRVSMELRNIRRAKVPFISATLAGDNLSELLGCIEGPPGTPYAKGIFWITIKLAENCPPVLRFHTRVYHPNIDCTGKICANYAGWWKECQSLNKAPESSVLWFSDSNNNHYSLGALLVALCGLLASPNLSDPLVPEIAEKYVTSFDEYCEAARTYTDRYARRSKPPQQELEFPVIDAPDEDSYSQDGILLVKKYCSPATIAERSTKSWEHIEHKGNRARWLVQDPCDVFCWRDTFIRDSSDRTQSHASSSITRGRQTTY